LGGGGALGYRDTDELWYKGGGKGVVLFLKIVSWEEGEHAFSGSQPWFNVSKRPEGEKTKDELVK